MKLRHLLFGLLAGVAFVACTNDNEPAGVTPAEGNKVAAANLYMAVDLQFPGSGAATRAIDNDLFEAATEDENAVSEVAFLFFKDDGTQAADPFVIKPNDEGKLIDANGDEWIPGVGEHITAPEANKKTALVVMKNPTAIPTSLVVLVNSDKTENDLAEATVESLQKNELDDFATGKTTKGKFVMSNSVYVAGGNVVVGAPVGSENIKESAAAAKTDPAPVKVYVERVVAKVTVAKDANMSTTDVPSGVTVTLNKWGFAFENKKSNLIKNLQATYNWGTGITWAGWNDPTKFRSYWADAALVPNEEDAQGNVTSVGNASTSWTGATNEFGTDKPYYTQEHVENLPQNTLENDGKPTAVIVTATIKKGNAAVDLYKFKGTLYEKAALITLMSNNAKVKQFYKADNDENPTVFKNLEPTDFDLSTSATDNPSVVNVNLKVTYTGKIYTADEVVADKAKETIEGIEESVQLFKGGATYYYVPIVQNSALNVNVKDPKAETPAYWGLFGVVRNHFYQLTIKSVKGLGTAVPDPGEIIVPTPPVDEESYIAAEINILDWKKVTQDVNLGE